MARLVLVVFAVMILTFVGSVIQAMPLRPDIVEKLASEGRLEQEKAFMEEAYSRGVNNFEESSVRLPIPGQGNMLMVTTRQAIVIIVDFDDNVADTNTYPASHYQDLLFSVGTYPTGSMRDYYIENSYGTFDVIGEISGWHRMPRDYSYYVDGQRGFGYYPRNAQKLTEDAVAAADPYVDFSQYDNDGPDGFPDSGDDDGYVDALFVVHAGPGYETTGDPNDIHSHAWVTSSPVPVDGVYVYRYSMEPEDGKIGVFAHEFGHVLGLPDLYDYGYDSRGAGYWSLMAAGSWGGSGTKPVHIDAWGKIELDFITPVVPTAGLIDIAVPRVEDAAAAYKIWSNGVPGAQYFVLEHRRQVGFDISLRGEGVVIYHVDENMPDNNSQRCGSGSPHYLVAVEQADGHCDLEYNNNSGDAGDPWPGTGGTQNPNHAFNLLSTPNTRDYGNNATGVSVYNIHLEGDSAYVSIAVAPVSPIAKVVSPNGGEYLETGTQDTVRWIAFDDLAVDSISILLSEDSGSTFPHVLGTGEPNDSVFLWDIEGVMSEYCRIKVIAYDNSGNSTEDISDADFEIFDVAGVAASQVAPFGVLSVRPNPAVGGTHIVFSSPSRSIDVSVHDVTGRLLAKLSPGRTVGSTNTFQAFWDGRNVRGERMSPGVYFIRVKAGEQAETTSIIIAK